MMKTIDRKVIKTVKTTVKYLIKRRRHQNHNMEMTTSPKLMDEYERVSVEEYYKSCISWMTD